MRRVLLHGAAALAVLMLAGAAPFDVREISSKKTDDLLLMCSNGGEACRDFVNGVLMSLNVAAVLAPVQAYKGCAPAPLSFEQVDELVLWLLSRPQLASGYAAQDIAIAAQDLWPCK